MKLAQDIILRPVITEETMTLNIIVSPLRHTRKNLEQIRDILKRYPGRSKVNLTIKDSLGHSFILLGGKVLYPETGLREVLEANYRKPLE